MPTTRRRRCKGGWDANTVDTETDDMHLISPNGICRGEEIRDTMQTSALCVSRCAGLDARCGPGTAVSQEPEQRQGTQPILSTNGPRVVVCSPTSHPENRQQRAIRLPFPIGSGRHPLFISAPPATQYAQPPRDGLSYPNMAIPLAFSLLRGVQLEADPRLH